MRQIEANFGFRTLANRIDHRYYGCNCNHIAFGSRTNRTVALTKLDLFKFMPFRLNRLAAEVSAELASEYRERYGLDIPEWRVLATLGFRDDACTAQYIAHCTRTHKSTISRAVAHLLEQQIIERVENEGDRRELALQLTRKGRTLYEELIPRLLDKEQDILSCLTAAERKDFAQALGKIEKRLDLVQTTTDARAKKDAY